MRAAVALLLAGLLILPAAMGLDGDFYTNSPATGEFVSSVSSGYPYKAGEITVEAEGVLPPTNEKLVIESLGNRETPASVRPIKNFDGEAHYIRSFDNVLYEEDLYAFTPKRPGLYEANITGMIRGMNDSQPRSYGDTIDPYTRVDEANVTASLKIWKDEEIVCNGPGYEFRNEIYDSYFYNSTYVVNAGRDGSARIYSEICGYFDKYSGRGGATGHRQDTNFEESRYGPKTDKDPRIKTEDVGGEHRKDIFTIENPLETNKTISKTAVFRIRNQDIKPLPEAYGYGDYRNQDDRKDGDIRESIFVKPDIAWWNGCDRYDSCDSKYAVGKLKIDDFTLQYIDPIGNTIVEVGNSIFTGKSKSYSDFSDTIPASDSGKWFNYSNKKSLDFDGNFGGLEYDDTKKIIVEGEFRADSPPGVTPEAYRIVNEDNTSQVLAKFDSIDSSKANEYVYKQVIRDTDTGASNLKSNNYTLQVKSTANNYPLSVGVKNLKIRPDQYIEVGDNETYTPQLDLGSNNVVVKTSNANSLRYRYEWTECFQPGVNIQPGNNTNIQTTDPILNVTTNCNSIDSIEFRNTETDTTIQKYQNIANNTKLEAPSEVSLGETYRWYIRFCDQGKCHNTGTYQFTVGTSSTNPGTGGTPPTQQDISTATAGLKEVIRDEDFNPFGKTKRTISPLSQGYINKIEESSDQLENKPTWSNSNGSEENADQYAITPSPAWTISNRGNIYPPPTEPGYRPTFYRDTADRRTRISDPSVLKRQKVFGNSLGVVAAKDVERDIDGDGSKELVARKGTGVWIDPDQMNKTKPSETYEYSGPGTWKQRFMRFNVDITGPDSGLGYDDETPGPPQYRQNRKVVESNIYWQRPP